MKDTTKLTDAATRSPAYHRALRALKDKDARHPYSRSSPNRSPGKRRTAITHGLEVGPLLPKLSPEQETGLQKQLLPDRTESFIDSKLTIAQLRALSKVEGEAQTEAARERTRRAGPYVPPPITEKQRALGRLMRYIALYENEYREEILEHMYKMQESTMPSRTAMEQQTDIQMHMRKSLIDFIIELHSVFHLRQETLYLAINIIDRYCSIRLVQKKNFQLIGCCALFIAAKYEDSKDHCPNTSDLKQYCRDVYEELAFRQMEGHILETLEWKLGHPTCEAWFRCMVNTLDRSGSDAAKEMAVRQGWAGLEELEIYGTPVIMADLGTQCIARYLMEIMIYQDALLDVPPCVVAEAALILAKVISWGTRERRNESAAALHVVRYLHLMLSGKHDFVSDAVFNKYKTNHYDGASVKVTTFYFNRFKQEDCLQRLEEIPDVTDKGAIAAMQAEAEKREQEKVEARYQKVQIVMAASVQGGQDDSDDEEGTMEEVDLRSDDAALVPALTFSDSGYGSCLGDEHAGDSSPEKKVEGSPIKNYIDASIPPLVLPDHYNYSPSRRSQQQQQQQASPSS